MTMTGEPVEMVEDPAHKEIEKRGGDDPGETGISSWPLIVTTSLCLLFAAGGHAVLWWAYARHANGGSAQPVPWQSVVGISLTGVAVLAFGGFYLVSGLPRVAIAASFLLTFLVLLTYVLTIDQLAGSTQAEGARQLIGDFRWGVVTILGAYFGAEAVVGVSKVKAAAGANASAAEIRAADSDLIATRH